MLSASASMVPMFLQLRRLSRVARGDLAEAAVVLDADALVVLVHRRLAGAIGDLTLVMPAVRLIALHQAVTPRRDRRRPAPRVHGGGGNRRDVVVALSVVADDIA